MDIASLQAELRTLQENKALWDEANLAGRAQARAFSGLLRNITQTRHHQTEALALYRQMSQIQRQLDEIDAAQVRQLRRRIAAGDYRGFALREELDRYTTYRPQLLGQAHLDLDNLDHLLRGVLTAAPFPHETLAPTPGMIHLELSPARVILELIDRTTPQEHDVFYDLGAGVGQVVLLVHLLTGIPARGVEVEPAYVGYARQAAEALNVARVQFINADARNADLQSGTLFYLFTPFRGALLTEVLQRLHAVAQDHPIQIGAYGACARHLAEQDWMTPQDDNFGDEFKLALFHSQGG